MDMHGTEKKKQNSEQNSNATKDDMRVSTGGQWGHSLAY